MSDVIPKAIRSDRSLFAVSIACFAAAGVASGADTLAVTGGATAVAIAGVYALANYAQRVSKHHLALVAAGCWTGFLAVAGLYLIGLATIGSIAPVPTGAIIVAVEAVTWSSLLAACGTTAFLGFREYGATTGYDEQVLDGDRPFEQ